MHFMWSGLLLGVCACGADAAPAAVVPPRGPESIAPQPVAPSPTSSAPPPSGPRPYPQVSIDRALTDNQGQACKELIYPRGCRRTRTGTVVVHMTVDDGGAVTAVEVKENTIANEPAVVEKCVLERLRTWKLDPPAEHERSFDFTLRFADKC